MVESIKHCIVLLQIAKSTINPIDAIHQPSPLDPVINTMPSPTVLPPEPAQLCKSEQRPSSLPIGPVLATLGHQTRHQIVQAVGTHHLAAVSLLQAMPTCLQTQSQSPPILAVKTNSMMLMNFTKVAHLQST